MGYYPPTFIRPEGSLTRAEAIAKLLAEKGIEPFQPANFIKIISSWRGGPLMVFFWKILVTGDGVPEVNKALESMPLIVWPSEEEIEADMKQILCA
jgi:hypothetical protein